MHTRKRAFTIMELTLASAVFGLLCLILASSLKSVSHIWTRTSARDEAIRNMLRAKSSLVRDLANSCGGSGQWAMAPVGPHLGSGKDSDALTFLSSDSGTSEVAWTMSADGKAAAASQITYYGVIPNSPQPDATPAQAGAPDAEGYEQQDPFKWLIRQVDVPPTSRKVDPSWMSWLTAPTGRSMGTKRSLVCDQLLQFRVLQGAPLWTIELRGVSLGEARRRLPLGSVPLSQGPYTVVERFTVMANN